MALQNRKKTPLENKNWTIMIEINHKLSVYFMATISNQVMSLLQPQPAGSTCRQKLQCTKAFIHEAWMRMHEVQWDDITLLANRIPSVAVTTRALPHSMWGATTSMHSQADVYMTISSQSHTIVAVSWHICALQAMHMRIFRYWTIIISMHLQFARDTVTAL